MASLAFDRVNSLGKLCRVISTKWVAGTFRMDNPVGPRFTGGQHSPKCRRATQATVQSPNIGLNSGVHSPRSRRALSSGAEFSMVLVVAFELLIELQDFSIKGHLCLVSDVVILGKGQEECVISVWRAFRAPKDWMGLRILWD